MTPRPLLVRLVQRALLVLLLLLPVSGCSDQEEDCADATDCEPVICGCGRFFLTCDLDRHKCITDCDILCDAPRPDAATDGEAGQQPSDAGGEGAGERGGGDVGGQ